MIAQQRLEDLIRANISLESPSGLGFEGVKCEVCNDYKIRGAFKFEEGQVRYNCFNCGAAGNFTEFSGRISKNMRNILGSFGLEDTDISTVVNTAFFNKQEDEETKVSLASLSKVSTVTPEIKLPAGAIKLGESDQHLDTQIEIAKYLEDRRIDTSKYEFYFSTEERFKNRVIIPFFRNNKLIYWQARTIDPNEKKRYDNAPVGRESVMFNMDLLRQRTDSVLFVVEGVFDAMSLDGIALLGSKITEAKLILLSESIRPLTFVIDKDQNGKALGEKLISAGMAITVAPEGANDVNESFKKYGSIWTVNELMKNTRSDTDGAKLLINLHCK